MPKINRKKCAVVFGANGFVGNNLVNSLLNENWEVWGIIREVKKNIIPINNEKLNLSSWDEIESIIDSKMQESFDEILVYHLAANLSVDKSMDNVESLINENISLTTKVLKFVKTLQVPTRLIVVSSDRIYGKADGNLSEEDRPVPIDSYGLGKFISEEVLRISSTFYSFQIIVARATNLYGPFQKSNQFIASLFKQLQAGVKTISVGNLDIIRDFLFIDDLIYGLILLSNYSSDLPFEIFHFSGKKYSLVDITSIFQRKVKEKLKKEIIFTISKKLTRNKIFELGNFSLSNKKSKNKLGWQNGTSLNKGLDLIFQKEILND